MNEEDIIRALQQSVIAAVQQSDQPTLPVAYLETKFTKPSAAPWLEIIWLPNNVAGDLWDSTGKTFRGILRLVLHTPVNQSGVYRPLALLGSIIRFYVKGLDLSGIQVYELPDLSGVIREGDETLYPVSIRYTSYRKEA